MRWRTETADGRKQHSKGGFCERSGEGAFGAHQNPRLMLGSVVGGVRLSVGVGGGDLEAVVLAETP